jgi:hypothetical protein
MSRPVNTEINGANQYVKFGVVNRTDPLAVRFLDVPPRSACPTPVYAVTGAYTTGGTFTASQLASDTLAVAPYGPATSLTGGVYYTLPTATDLLTYFNGLGTNRTMRFWVLNKGSSSAFFQIPANSTSNNATTYHNNVAAVQPATGNAVLGGINVLRPITIEFDTINGSGALGLPFVPLQTTTASGPTGTYIVY